MSDFRLNDIETRTPLWQALRAHYLQKLAALRCQNDSDLDPVRTARLRGRIEEIRQLLALERPAASE